MNINKAGLELIKSFEGLRLKGYLCPAGVPTVGYGHTGPEVKVGMVITKEQAEAYLRFDLAKFEKAVTAMTKVQINSNEFSALVSLAYNIGPGSAKDTKKRGLYWSSVIRNLNEDKRAEAAVSILNHNKARDPKTGKLVVLEGLKRRREAEKKLFLTKDEETFLKDSINFFSTLQPLPLEELIPTRALLWKSEDNV